MNKKLWTFPVPSNCIYSGIKLIYESTKIKIIFDYYDENNHDKIYNGRLEINGVIAHRHTIEKFTTFIKGTYDNLCEIKDSKWLSNITKCDPKLASIGHLKHYAIYFDSYGLYEFIASDFLVSEIKRGVKGE